MDETRTHGVGELLQGIFRKQRRQPSLALQRLRQNWVGIVGEPLGRVTWPARLARGVLWITALDSGWAFNLQFVKADLLNAARTFLESGDVAEIRFKVGALPAGMAQSAAERDAPPEAETHAVEAPQVADAPVPPPPPAPPQQNPSTIADPILRKGFQRLAAKLLARRPKGIGPSHEG
jgi:predicted nucleic acid-binding Zn ribbon protein